MREITIEINHKTDATGRNAFDIAFKFLESGEWHSGQQRITEETAVVTDLLNAATDVPMEVLVPTELSILRTYGIPVSKISDAVCFIQHDNGALHIKNLPLLNGQYTIKTNYPIVLSQESLKSFDTGSVAAQFRDKNVPSCTIVTTKPSVHVVFANIVLFDVLKLSCLESQLSVQGLLRVNRLEGSVHILLNTEKSQVRIDDTMNLESCRGGVINQGVWDALEAHCSIDMAYFYNQPTGRMFCGTLLGYKTIVGGPVLTNEGYLKGGRLEDYFAGLICTKGSQTVFESAGVYIKQDLKVAGLFIHEDSAKYTVNGLAEIQTGGRFFARRCLEIAGADNVVVRKEAFLGAKFSLQCPVRNLVIEEGSYYGCPGYTTLDISNSLTLKGETIPGYSLVVEAKTLFAETNSQQKYSDIKVQAECRNAGILSAEDNRLNVGSFVNMPGGSVIGEFLHIEAQRIENQGARASLGYELLMSLSTYSLETSLQNFALLGLMLYSNIQGFAETSREAFAITEFEAILAPYQNEAQEQPLLLHSRFESEILPKIRLLATDDRIQSLQSQLPKTQTLVKNQMSSEVGFRSAYRDAGLRREVGFIGATTSLLLNAPQVVNTGILVSKWNLTVQSVSEITNLMSAYLLAYGTLSLKSQAILLNMGNIIAKCQVNCTTKDWFKQLGGGRLSAEAISVFSERIEHSGITQGERLHLHAKNTLEQFVNGTLSATKAITLLAGQAINQGVIECCGNIFMVVQHLVQNQIQGKISAKESLIILCGSVVRHAGSLESGTDFIAIAKKLFEDIVLDNPIDIVAVDILTNFAIENAGLLSGKNVSLISTSRAWVKNLKEGVIQSEALAMGGEKLQNLGLIKADKAILKYKTLIEISETGLIDVKDLIELIANRVNNHGTVKALKDICINARLLFKNKGTLLSIDSIAVFSATFINAIEKTGSSELAILKKEAQEILRQVQSKIEPDQIKIEQLIQFALNNAGILAGHYPRRLAAPGIDCTKPISVETQLLLSHLETGVLSRKALIQIKAGKVENTGIVASLGQVSIVADEVVNFNKGIISAQAGLAVMCTTLLENTGYISAYQNIRITAQQLLQSLESGKILSQEDVHLIVETSLVNAGVISGKKVNIMRRAMETFLAAQSSETEPPTLREHLIVQNLNSGLIKATDALTILAESGENAGHLEADSARLHFEKHFTQSGRLATEGKLSIEAGNIITLLQQGKVTAKGAVSLLAKQRVFTQSDILAYQSLTIMADTLEHAGGKIEGYDTIQFTVGDWILKGDVKSQKQLIAKIKNTWDWQAEGTFSAAKDGAVSLEFEKGYTFTRPITLATTFNVACNASATLQNLTNISVDAFGAYGGTFCNGSDGVFASVTASTGKYTFDGVHHDNQQGGLYAATGFDMTAPHGIVNGRGHNSYMVTPGSSTFRTPCISNNYAQLRVGPNSEFLGQVGQDVLVNLSGDVDIAGNATIRGNVRNTMLYQVTNSGGVTRGRALSKRPIFTIQGNLNQQGLFENVGGEVLVGGETHVSQGGFIGRALEEYDAWTTTEEIRGRRRGGVSGLCGRRNHHTITTNHKTHHAMHLGNYTFRGPVYSHDAGYFDFSSVHMEEGMRGLYRYFRIDQPHDTTTLSEYARARMGLFTKSLHLIGVPGSEMVFNSQQHIAGDCIIHAPGGRFTQKQKTRTAYELAQLDKEAVALQPVTKINPGTGETHISGTLQALFNDFHLSGKLSYGTAGEIFANLMTTEPVRTTSIESNRRAHAVVPHFTPSLIQGQGDLNITANIILGNAHYNIDGQATFQYTDAMVLPLIREDYQLPQEKQKRLFKNVYSGGTAPVIAENVINASRGVVFISANGQTVLENTHFPSGQPVFKVPPEKLKRPFQYPQPNLYRYSRLNLTGQLGIAAVSAAAGCFTGTLLANALLPTATTGAAGATASSVLTATQAAVFVGAAQGAIGNGVYATLTKGNIAKNMLQGAVLAGLGSGIAKKLEVMEVFNKVRFIDPEALRRAAVSVPVAMAGTRMNNGNVLKSSLLALGASLMRSALPTEKLENLSSLDAVQQEATNACIVGITMAVVTGANSQQAVSMGLQSAGFAVANLAGESLSTWLVASHLAYKRAKEAEQSMTAQNPKESEAQKPAEKVNSINDNVAYSHSKVIKVVTKEASRLLAKDGIQISDAEIKSAFEAHPALQGSPQDVRAKLIKLGHAKSAPKDTQSAFLKGLDKVFASTINRLMGFVGIGEAHAENRNSIDAEGLQRYSPELERRIFLSRGLTEELRRNSGARTTLSLQPALSSKALLFRAPSNRPANRFGKLSQKQSANQPERSPDGLYKITVKISTDSPSGHVYIQAPIVDETGKITVENIGFYPVRKEFDIRAGISRVPAKIIVEDNDTNKGAKHLVVQSLWVTEKGYKQLAKNLRKAIDNPGFYNLFGVGADNCLTFIDRQLKAIGIVDGLSNKFDIVQYARTSFAPIKLQANYLFDQFKTQKISIACGSENIVMSHQCERQLLQPHIEEENRHQAIQHFKNLTAAQQNMAATTKLTP